MTQQKYCPSSLKKSIWMEAVHIMGLGGLSALFFFHTPLEISPENQLIFSLNKIRKQIRIQPSYVVLIPVFEPQIPNIKRTSTVFLTQVAKYHTTEKYSIAKCMKSGAHAKITRGPWVNHRYNKGLWVNVCVVYIYTLYNCVAIVFNNDTLTYLDIV